MTPTKKQDFEVTGDPRVHLFSFKLPMTLALILAVTVVSIAPTTAAARSTRVYQAGMGTGSFPADARASALAVDQATGDVYVVRSQSGLTSSRQVLRFDSSGAPKNFTAGPDAGTNALTGLGDNIGQIAIDNSGGPLDGTLYVAEANFTKKGVRVYSTSGESKGFIVGSSAPNGEFYFFSAITVDQSNGDLYIGDSFNQRVWRYSPNSPSGSINDSDYSITNATVVDSLNYLDVGDGYLYASRRIAGTPDEDGSLVRR